MLDLQQQGRKECLPTSIAMLLGVPKQQVLDLFQELDPERRPFIEIFREDPNVFWRTAWRVLDFAFGPTAVKAYQAAVGWNGIDGRGGLWATSGKGPSVQLPKTGRGLLQLFWTDGDRKYRHTLAYDEGLVYDPAEFITLTWEEYEVRYPGWRIEGAIPTP